MTTIILTIHLFLALGMIISVLLQRSEGGALGIGGGGGGMMTGRAQANLLTRLTAALAAAFIATSLILAIMASQARAPRSIVDQGSSPVPTAPATPAAPTRPGPPLGR
jgi:preprotein translocase subunit SecG